MFCLKCGEAMPDNVSFCPFCGTKIGENKDTEKAIVYVEKVNEGSAETRAEMSPKMLDKMKSKSWGRGVAIVMCVLAVILIVFGYKSITDSSYKYAVDNYKYYEQQMKETKSMANIYGGTGILGRGYANISSSWEDMLEEAQKTILTGRVKAGIGFGLGFVLLLLAIFLFVKGKRGFRYNEKPSIPSVSVRKTGNTSFNINDRECAIIAAICLGIYSAFRIYNVVSSMLKYDYYSMSVITVINYIALISLAIMLFIGKRHIGFLIASGSVIALYIYNIIEVASAGFSFEVMKAYFLEGISHIILFVLLLFAVIDVLSKKDKVIRFLWFVPAAVYLVSFVINCIRWEYFSDLPSTWKYIIFNLIYVIALFFVGLWIRTITKNAENCGVNVADSVETGDNEI